MVALDPWFIDIVDIGKDSGCRFRTEDVGGACVTNHGRDEAVTTQALRVTPDPASLECSAARPPRLIDCLRCLHDFGSTGTRWLAMVTDAQTVCT